MPNLFTPPHCVSTETLKAMPSIVMHIFIAKECGAGGGAFPAIHLDVAGILCTLLAICVQDNIYALIIAYTRIPSSLPLLRSL